MQKYRIVLLVCAVIVLTTASLILWFTKNPISLTPDSCSTDPSKNPQVLLRKENVSKTQLSNGHIVTTVSTYPGIEFTVGDEELLIQKLNELNIWQGTGLFSTKSLLYETPQDLCIILAQQPQPAGQVVDETDENRILKSFSSEFDYQTRTYKVYIHLDPSFYKVKAPDRGTLSAVLSYTIMEQLFESSTSEENRVVDNLEQRRSGKKEFMMPFVANPNSPKAAPILVTKLNWPDLQ